jgi:ribonucleoside-diphosphate reductase alpha chain
LDGLFSTDGNIDLSSNHPFLRLKTTSKQLAQDVRRVLLSFGIHGRIVTIKKVADGRIGDRAIISRHQQYEVIISGAGMKVFAQEIGLSHPDKQQRLKTAQKEFALTGNTWLARITSIEPDGIETVYDLHEPVSDTWITEGMVSRGCGEQPLGAMAVCNLGAMNLSAYVKGDDLANDKAGKFDYESFAYDVKVAMRFLDNVIDQTYYFFKENEKVAKEIRRTGLGIMGLGDALIKMHVKYGSEESVTVLEKIFKTLRDSAYESSSDIAKEKGSFTKYDKEQYQKGYHIKALPKALREKIYKQGIRNAVLLTIAPTGTTSLVSGVSSGVEPVYEFSFLRRWRGGEEIVYHPLFEIWKKAHPDTTKPAYFASANDLTPLEHTKVQAIAQEYIDSSISKTVNAPNSHTVADVQELYMAAYDMGLKGVTYMRDGSRQGVLERVVEKKEEKKEEAAATPMPILPFSPRPLVLQGQTYQADSPIGKTYITINNDQYNEPFEIFITNGKSGSDVMALAEALGRVTSLLFRLSSPVPMRERMRKVVSELSGIGGAKSVGFGENRVRSLPDAVAKVLAKHYEFKVNGKVEDKAIVAAVKAVPQGEVAEMTNGQTTGSSQSGANVQVNIDTMNVQQLTLDATASATTHLYDICPECGSASFAYEEGCKKCYGCGYSEC